MHRYLKAFLCGSAAIGSLAATSVAYAAEAGDSAQVEELVVTAQKRSENVQSIPASISAVGGAELQQRGVTSPTDLQFVVPSMQAGRLLGQTSITIRGVGLNQGSPGVAIHVDGVYQPRPSMGDLTQIDIARVEVLRGPQGTLYGRNANGGVVNYVTQAPTDHMEGYVLGSYASFNDTRLQAMVNAPFGDRVRARLVIDRWDRSDGFIKNVTPGGQDLDKGQTLASRLRVTAQLTDTLDLDLSATGLHGTGPTSYFTLYNTPTATAVALNPYLKGVVVPLQPRHTAANDPVDDQRNLGQVSGTLTWRVGDLQLKSITGYTRLVDHELRDDDAIGISAFPSQRWARSRTLTQELNLSGTFGPVDAVVGAFYMRDVSYDRLRYDFQLGIFPLPPKSELDFESYRLLTTSAAIFGDATFRISDRARLIAGIRYSEDKLTQTQRNQLSFGPTPPITTCPLQTNDITFHSTTPKLGAQYDLSADSNLYATYAKGFKDGGFNLYACKNVFQPEEVTSYEAGWKNRLLDGSLILNASAFYYDYTNLQLNQTVGLTSLITNAAAAKVKGLELESTWRPESHWTLNGNLSLLSAKFAQFVNTDSLAPALGPQNVKGHYLANAPKVSANVGVAYRTDPILAGGRLTLRTDVSYRSKVYFREFNNALDSQPAYTVVNAAVIWDSADEKYRVRLFASNLGDQDYIVRMNSSDNFGSRYVSWGAPRQVGVELKANF